MAFLKESELATYAPGVTLTGPALVGAIALAQAQIEGIRGANRKLEVQSYTNIYRLNIESQTFRIQEYPLIELTQLRTRFGNIRTRFGHPSGLGDWIDVDPDDYIFDFRNGLVTINRSFLFSGGSSGFSFSTGHGRRASYYTEVEATFSAGFNFEEDPLLDSDIIALKASVGQILTYQQTSAINQGIKSKDVEDDYKVEYFNGSGGSSDRVGAGIGQVPDGMLELAKQYRIVGNPGMRG